MISYDEFCKLPIFKKGYIAINRREWERGYTYSVWHYDKKPILDKKTMCWYTKGEFDVLRGFDMLLINTICIFDVDFEGIKPEESLRKVGGKSKISHCMSTDLSIGDKVYILQQDGLWYVYNKTLQITDIYFHYYPKNKTESVGLFLCDDKTDGERSLVYDRKDVYKTKKEAQKECDRRNAELKRKEQK